MDIIDRSDEWTSREELRYFTDLGWAMDEAKWRHRNGVVDDEVGKAEILSIERALHRSRHFTDEDRDGLEEAVKKGTYIY